MRLDGLRWAKHYHFKRLRIKYEAPGDLANLLTAEAYVSMVLECLEGFRGSLI